MPSTTLRSASNADNSASPGIGGRSVDLDGLDPAGGDNSRSSVNDR